MTVIDSHLRCPRCGKRMHMDIGQDDITGAGDMRAEHQCWNCDYREQDRDWSRPLKTDPVARAEWLKRKRLEGWRQDIRFPEVGEWLSCALCQYGTWRNHWETTATVLPALVEHARTMHAGVPVADVLWPLEVPDGA